MSALELIQWSTTAVFVAIAIVTLANLARRRSRANLDVALLFLALGVAVVESRLASALGLSGAFWSVFTASLVMALPYLLLRLVDGLTTVRPEVLRVAALGLALSIGALVVFGGRLPFPGTLALTVYFAVFALYAGFLLVPASRHAQGVTRRRMQAISLGSLLLGVAILMAGVSAADQRLAGISGGGVQLLAFASALSWLLGFAPPRAVRRLWQEPELRAFLARAAKLPRLPDTPSIVRALEEGAAASTGARAAIGLWDEARQVMVFSGPTDGVPLEFKPGEFLAWTAFESGTATFVEDVVKADPRNEKLYRSSRVGAAIVAPIAAAGRRLGVLVVYAERAPTFADDDVALARLLAEQAAVILESRTLIDEAARARAHEEAARLKEDFVSAAAHDLKTPLTTLVAQAQTLERKMRHGAQADLPAVERIAKEAKRLHGFVEELLDAARIEQRSFQLARERVDLAALARELCRRHPEGGRLQVSAAEAVHGLYDRARIEQLLQNLIENAIKFSPARASVEVHVSRGAGDALLSVRDRGIGIPVEDLEVVFDRFRRGSNVDDRRFAGMGLGLFICRGIAEGHGGRIWVESSLGEGSTFHVALPLHEPALH